MKTPVLFIIFNRPETTQKVFDVIKQVKPTQLFVAADGPRKNKQGEMKLCEQTRDIVLKEIDWDCEVKTLFREENLGCGKAVSEAISWFFENVEQGIILEDDCLPSISFFSFCEKMLDRYRDNKKVMMISGSNPATSFPNLDRDYYFSRVYSIWGWATWRRAWNLYDKKMQNWPTYKKNKFLKLLYKNNMVVNYFSTAFDNVFNDQIDTWDYQWTFTCMKNGLNIIPKYNMISNIGINGTHTGAKTDKALFIKSFEIKNKTLNDPLEIKVNEKLDSEIFKISRISKPSFRKIINKLLINSGIHSTIKRIINNKK
jgi:hypothetical protein